jgi:hypothetical protein
VISSGESCPFAKLKEPPRQNLIKQQTKEEVMGRGRTTKVTPDTCRIMKIMHENGTSTTKIAEVFRVSVSTYNNVKRNNWNYKSYRNYVGAQFDKMKQREEVKLAFKSNDDDYYSVIPTQVDVIDSVALVTRLAVEVKTLSTKIDKLTEFIKDWKDKVWQNN